MTPDFVCPRCRRPVVRTEADEATGASYDCAGCGGRYPVLFGIPDFRLGPDAYLSLAAEREKAGRLHALSRDHDFAGLLAAYYAMTDDVPAAQVPRFSGYVLDGVARGEAALDHLGPDGAVLDLGCHAGGLLVAAARAGRQAVGLDIALRWLVLASKRLEEEGVEARLVCADLRAPPFPPGSFAAIAAIDLLEHLGDQDAAARAIAALAAPGARLYVTAANRHTLLPYPLAGLWGVGAMPRGLRGRYLRWRRGLDTLRHATPVSPSGVGRRFRRAGLTVRRMSPLAAGKGPRRALGAGASRLLPLYARLRTAPVAGPLLLQIGPAFEAVLEKPAVRDMKGDAA